VIQTYAQMLLAQQCIGKFAQHPSGSAQSLFAARLCSNGRPILLEVQQREQEILDYLSRDLEQPVAS